MIFSRSLCFARAVQTGVIGARSYASDLRPRPGPYWDPKDIKSFDEVPGPKTVQEFSTPEEARAHAHRAVENFTKLFEQYGPVVRQPTNASQSVLHLFHPYDIYMVYTNEGKYPLRSSHAAMDRYRKERPHLYNNPGLGSSNGEEWRKMRSLLKLGMLMNSAQHYQNALELTTDDLLDRIHTSLDEKGELDIAPWLFRWALECIGFVSLGQNLGCLAETRNAETEDLIRAAQVTHEMVYLYEHQIGDSEKNYKQLVEAQDYFSSVVRKYVDETYSRGDEMALANSVRVEGADPKDTATLVLDLILGGIHSISFSLTFALYHLAKNKLVQEDTRKVVVERLPDKSYQFVELGYTELIPHVKHVVEESLRLNPPAIGTGRILSDEVILGGYRVPAGVSKTIAILQHQVASRQEHNFVDALSFRPERWRTPGMLPRDFFAHKPFGSGGRTCVGARFAQSQMNMLISKLIREFEVSYHYGDLKTVNKLINEPDRPCLLQFECID